MIPMRLGNIGSRVAFGSTMFGRKLLNFADGLGQARGCVTGWASRMLQGGRLFHPMAGPQEVEGPVLRGHWLKGNPRAQVDT